MKRVLFVVLVPILFALMSGCDVSKEADKILNSSSSTSSAISSQSSSSSSVTDSRYTYSQWSLNCPSPLTYRVVTSGSNEYHQCVVDENEFYNLKVIQIDNSTKTEDYYLVFATGTTRANSYESQRVRSTKTDLTTNVMYLDYQFEVLFNKGIEQGWVSNPKYYRNWFRDSGCKAEESIYNNQRDVDGVYRYGIIEHRYYWCTQESLLRSEYYSTYKQNDNGYWAWPIIYGDEWYSSGNQFKHAEFILKQNDGSWVSLIDSLTLWYDKAQKQEETIYYQLKKNGIWSSYTDTKKTWCENGTLSADFTGTITESGNTISEHITGPTYPCN